MDTTSLFREINPVRWREVGHNPIAMLSDISIEELEQTASQLVLHSRINYAYRRMQEYVRTRRLGAPKTPACYGPGPWPISRPSLACTNRSPFTPGAWRVLAGDHLKSASDLGIPLTAIGLFYDQGYFRQRVTWLAGRKRSTSTPTFANCRWNPPLAATASL